MSNGMNGPKRNRKHTINLSAINVDYFTYGKRRKNQLTKAKANEGMEE